MRPPSRSNPRNTAWSASARFGSGNKPAVIWFREQACGHLARIIVSPLHRGLGLGRVLCRALMREAPRLHPIKAYSLYVFPDNTTAIALYRSLGFVEQGMHPQFNCVLMQAPSGSFPRT